MSIQIRDFYSKLSYLKQEEQYLMQQKIHRDIQFSMNFIDEKKYLEYLSDLDKLREKLTERINDWVQKNPNYTYEDL